MLDKNCPFCMSYPIAHWNEDETIYILECPNCSKNGITIKCEHKNPNEAHNLWNNRLYDNYIINNIDDIKKIITEEQGLGVSDEHQEIFDVLRLDNKNDGYFIMPNLDIIECQDGHVKELLHYLNIFTENNLFTDVSTICLNIGVIRVSVMTGCLMVAIPIKYKRKQIDKLVELLCKTQFNNLKTYYFYQLLSKDNEIYEQFNQLNEIIMKIEEIK
jgi:hypothetical protein